jgi:hypothetical protein
MFFFHFWSESPLKVKKIIQKTILKYRKQSQGSTVAKVRVRILQPAAKPANFEFSVPQNGHSGNPSTWPSALPANTENICRQTRKIIIKTIDIKLLKQSKKYLDLVFLNYNFLIIFRVWRHIFSVFSDTVDGRVEGIPECPFWGTRNPKYAGLATVEARECLR